ncbi:hypothetical protein ACAF76_000515 [Brevibacillus sp. TJ4]|uniref:hypothetical protein n=1 Tax=Brevibacillus sp. TJ4 TaxID=3234853 RepID=UPI0037D6E5AC
MYTYFSVCSTESYQQKYIVFLLENYEQLRLPYPFSVSLSFLASPILLEREAILALNEEEEPVAAFSYIYGTGENNYQDKDIVQVQIAFISEPYRNTRLFLRGLQFLIEYIESLDEPVKEFRFWAPADDDCRTLFGKMATLSSSVDTVFGRIDEYRSSFAAWKDYAARFRYDNV